MFHVPAHKNTEAPAGQVGTGMAALHALADAQSGAAILVEDVEEIELHDVQPDFIVAGHGSVYLLTPKTAEARDWCDQNLPADAPRWAGSFAIEHRYIENILHGIDQEGLGIAA
jgi:hypothetical protein